MNKSYFLLPILAVMLSASAFAFPISLKIGVPVYNNCFEAPTLTVEHPHCESPYTATVTVTTPIGASYLYSIDGVNYQASPIFLEVLPGLCTVTYKEVFSACVSEPNSIVVQPAVPFASIALLPEHVSTQTLCINTAMDPIRYALGGTATNAQVTGLPVGVSGVFADGIFTVSGTPSIAGIYAFTVATDGFCPAIANGVIVVMRNAALVWVSTSGNRNQTICKNMPIIPISYIVANGATGADVTGLPAGLSGNFSEGIYTLSGTPAVSGAFNFNVTTFGGCSQAFSTGGITINEEPILNLQCVEAPQNSLAFAWDAIQGATGYLYNYAIDEGPTVSGTISSDSNFTVEGVMPSQSVVFTINAINGAVSCFNAQSVTCLQAPLENQSFQNAKFTHYPNPVIDFLYLSHTQPIERVGVFNTLGQEVSGVIINATEAKIDLSQLTSGIYFVKIDSAKKSQTIPVVKK